MALNYDLEYPKLLSKAQRLLRKVEASESRQLITLSLLNEARVKLRDKKPKPTNLLKRIDKHMQDCCK